MLGIVITILGCILSVFHGIVIAGGIEKWQYYNIGQTVDGVRGKYRVDINAVHLVHRISRTDKVTVAIVDSGLYYESESIKQHILINSDEIEGNGIDDDANGLVDDVYGWDFYNNDNTLYDNYVYDYHATYIANEIINVNQNAIVLPCKILEGSKGDTADAVSAIEYAIENGARVINCSWSFFNNDTEVERVIKSNPDVLFVCSSGNTNLDLDCEELYPACLPYDNIIVVGAISNDGSVYRYGGYGKKNVDILAPGDNILACLPEGDYDYISGTSVAAAYVSGAASILIGKNDELSPKEIRAILINTAKQEEKYLKLCVASGYLDICKAYKSVARR